MNEFIKMLLSLSLAGTLLLMVVLFLKQFYKNVFSRCWQYYILLLAALRFMLPVAFDYNIAGYLYGMAVNITAQDNVPGKNITVVQNKEDKTVKEVEEIPGDTTQNIKQGVKNLAKNAAFSSYLLNCIKYIYKYCFYIWLVPAAVFIVHKITAYKKFADYIKVTGVFVQDTSILNMLAECEEKLGIKRTAELYCSSVVSSPVLAGFFHPYIIIPVNHMEDENLFYVFLHELIHYKRGDIFYKWFIQIIMCVHWFNPFTLLLANEVNKACELSCDEAVISMLNKNERKIYGDTLLSFVRTKETYKNPLGTITLTEGAKQLKERLGAIMDYKKKSVVIKSATVIITVIICFSFPVAGAYAAINGQRLKSLNQKNTEVINNANNTALKGSKVYTYTQNGYYYNSYIFEMGWNLGAKAEKTYKNKIKINKKDNSGITVCFSSSIKKYSKDKKVISAIEGLVNSMGDTYPVMESVLITRIIPVKAGDIPSYAEKYYKNKELVCFSALFPHLDKKVQKKYLDKMYKSGNISFFSSVIECMEEDLISEYADKASADGKITFLSVLLNYVQKEDLQRYAKESYKFNNITQFSVLTSYMTKKELKNWLSKAEKDQKVAFCTILLNKL